MNLVLPRHSSLGIFRYLYIGLLFFTFQACTGSKNLDSHRAASTIALDGDFTGWPSGSLNTGLIDEFDVAIANDDDYVYIGVNFKNNRVWQMARDHGFRIYIDSDATFRRSFGLVFPTGIVEALGDYPGARKNYLENPSWQNLPENKVMVERAESQMGARVQIIRRTSSSDRIRPATVSKAQLEANGIRFGMSKSSRVMSMEVRIPIDDGDGNYFSVIPNKDGRFNIDFEVEPMTYEQVTGETPSLETVDSANNRDHNRQSTRPRQQLNVSNPQLYAQLGYHFQTRLQVRLNR